MSNPLGAALLLAFQTASTPDPFTRAQQAAQAYKAGDYAAAEAEYRSLAGDLPAAPSGLLGLGRSLARLGRVDEALEWLGKAASLGAGADAAGLQAAFETAADAPEVRALLSRFRGNRLPLRAGDGPAARQVRSGEREGTALLQRPRGRSRR